MSANKWVPRERNYEKEFAALLAQNPEQNVSLHPLSSDWKAAQTKSKQPAKQTKQAATAAEATFDDPLSAGASSRNNNDDFIDPLTAAASRLEEEQVQNLVFETARMSISLKKEKDAFMNWNVKKAQILKKYTTDRKLPVVSKIVDENEGDPKVVSSADRVKLRLEQLEREEQTSVEYMTQDRVIKYLETLDDDLKDFWAKGNRVEALKIAIKCAKSLGENSVPQFYPSVFVLVSQVLDTFGKLVFERLRSRSEEVDPITGKPATRLPDNFSADDVSEEAKETCRNWFFKIASIRELLPRLYVEMSILKCNLFLSDDLNRIKSDLVRLARGIRGIGDPLVAMCARCYLARKGYEILPNYKEHLHILVDDFFFVQRQWDNEDFQKTLKSQGMEMKDYLDLYTPALEMMMEIVGHNADEKIFHTVLEKYEASCNKSFVLNTIISSFEAHIVSNSASLLVFLIKESDDSTTPKYVLFRSLGKKFTVCPPLEKHRLQLLNEVWKIITQLESVSDYVSVAEVFIEYVVKNFKDREVNILLGDLRKHLTKDKTYEILGDEIQGILCTILDNMDDFASIFAMDNFLPIMDLLKTSSRSQVSKGILAVFSRQKRLESDPVIINSIFDVARNVHDSINAMTSEEEKKSIGELICKFITKVDFGRDVEQQLNFYTECRSMFSNLDQVKDTLVLCVLSLVTRTLTMVKGKHTKKTSSFVKGGISFVHITIPSIEDIFTRLRLFVLSGQVALMNNAVAQAETLFRAAIASISEVPSIATGEDNKMIMNEDILVSFLCSFASTLLIIPGHPEHGPFYLVKRLLNVIQEYPWEHGGDSKIAVYTHMLAALAAFYQEKLPYHSRGVNANDELYVHDSSFKEEIVTIGNTILDEINTQLNNLANDPDVSAKYKHARASLDLYNVLIGTARPMEPTTDRLYKAVEAYTKLPPQAPGAGTPKLDRYLAASLAYKKKLAVVPVANK